MRRVAEIAADAIFRVRRVGPQIVSVVFTVLFLLIVLVVYNSFHKRDQYIARCVQRAYHRGECTAGIQDVCEARWFLRDGIEEK